MNYMKILTIGLCFIMMSLTMEKYVNGSILEGYSSSSDELLNRSEEEQREENRHFLNKQLLDYFRSETMKRARSINNKKLSNKNYFYQTPFTEDSNEELNVNLRNRFDRKRGGKFAIPRMG
jgi:hypothetical protein